MAFSFGNIQTFVRHCVEPHVIALKKLTDSFQVKLKKDVRTELYELKQTCMYRGSKPNGDDRFYTTFRAVWNGSVQCGMVDNKWKCWNCVFSLSPRIFVLF